MRTSRNSKVNSSEELRKDGDMERIETVDADCKHVDCVYRVKLNQRGEYFCNYAVMERHSRGCSISKCDKYRKGSKKATIISVTKQVEWEITDE